MFNDKYKIYKILVPIFFIWILVCYAQLKGPIYYPGYKEAKKQPKLFIGKKINFGGRITEIKDNYFYVEIDKEPIKVFGQLSQGKINYSIAGEAVYLAGGSLKLSQSHTSNIRTYRVILSIIPIIIVAYWFFQIYRFNSKKKIFEIKN